MSLLSEQDLEKIRARAKVATDAGVMECWCSDIFLLFAELEERDGIIHDMMDDVSAFRAGREVERGEIIATLNRLIADTREEEIAEALDTAANLLADNADVLHPPPVELRRENARLREACRGALKDLTWSAASRSTIERALNGGGQCPS